MKEYCNTKNQMGKDLGVEQDIDDYTWFLAEKEESEHVEPPVYKWDKYIFFLMRL